MSITDDPLAVWRDRLIAAGIRDERIRRSSCATVVYTHLVQTHDWSTPTAVRPGVIARALRNRQGEPMRRRSVEKALALLRKVGVLTVDGMLTGVLLTCDTDAPRVPADRKHGAKRRSLTPNPLPEVAA